MNVLGKIVARKCDSCGHHEIGLETENGEYIVLKPDMRCVLMI